MESFQQFVAEVRRKFRSIRLKGNVSLNTLPKPVGNMPRFGDNQFRVGDDRRGRRLSQNAQVIGELNEEPNMGKDWFDWILMRMMSFPNYLPEDDINTIELLEILG